MNVDYEWQKSYAAAVLETDRARLAERIDEATAAIHQRLLELSRDHGGAPEERLAIDFALSALKLLSKDAAPPTPRS